MPPRTCSSCGKSISSEAFGSMCERCEANQLWQPSPWATSYHYGGRIVMGPDSGEEAGPARVDDKVDADRAPDLIEPVLAWRGWEVTPDGHLTASAVSGVWDPGTNRAVCRKPHHTDDVPAVGCSCGFYAWHEPQDIAHGQVRGAIRCWGEIIVHDVGVRAEYAEIVCLFAGTAPDVFLKRAADKYGVPIVGDQAEAEKLAAKQGIRVPMEMRPERVERQDKITINFNLGLPNWSRLLKEIESPSYPSGYLWSTSTAEEATEEDATETSPAGLLPKKDSSFGRQGPGRERQRRLGR